MENPTEAWHNFVRWLVKEGYTDEEIEKVTGGNVLRALETIWD
jgi:membrane dipeptidase